MMEWVAEQPASRKAPSTNAPSSAPNRIPACGMREASPNAIRAGTPADRGSFMTESGGAYSALPDPSPIASRMIRRFAGQENGTARRVVKEALRAPAGGMFRGPIGDDRNGCLPHRFRAVPAPDPARPDRA